METIDLALYVLAALCGVGYILRRRARLRGLQKPRI